jgi:hypothetical protein
MNRPDDLISVLTEDHRELRQLYTELEFLSGGESLRRRLTDQLIVEMVRHSRWIFPELTRHVSEERLVTLGRRAKNAKAKAPTRPVPGPPSLPLLHVLLEAGTGLVERARGHLCGRGKAYPEIAPR